MPKTKKTIAKAASVEKNIAVAMDKIAGACKDVDRAIAARGKSGKRLLAEVRKLNKKRGTLLRRKAAASKRAAREPNATNRKAVRDVVKELTSTRKALAKARELKKANTTELTALRSAARHAKSYQKAVDKTQRTLARTSKKRKRR